MTETDIFPAWRTVLEDDRQLLKKFAPRFADQEIIRLRSPLLFEAITRRAAGDNDAADQFLELSGIPQLTAYLRRSLLERAANIRIANGHRLALTVLWQLDGACKAQLATLNGDTAPLQELQDRQRGHWAPPRPTLQRQSDDLTEQILEQYLLVRESLLAKPVDLCWSTAERRFQSTAMKVSE